MSPASLTKVKKTADGLLIFTYNFDYTREPVAITVTLSEPGQSASSPPESPPSGGGETPKTLPFEKGSLQFNLKMENGDPLDGVMSVRLLGPSHGQDNAAIWCNVHYGFNRYRNFQGVSVTFPTSLP